MLSGGRKPPGTPSFMLILAVTAMVDGTTARTAATTCRANLERFSSEPAHSSLRLLNFGLRNDERR